MTKKLTPRVGDRVTFVRDGKTQVADVQNSMPEDAFAPRMVWVTGGSLPSSSGLWVQASEVKVVDREPVEWPEGWKKTNAVGLVYAEEPETTYDEDGVYMNKRDLAFILKNGPYVLEHWDDLMS